MRSLRVRRLLWIGSVLAGLLILGGSAALLRMVFLQTARRVLAGWTEAGLPGDPPRGDGPVVDLRWPPRLRWTDLRWVWSESVQLTCRELEIGIVPWSLVRGRLRVDRVEVRDLRVRGHRHLSRWTDPVLGALSRPVTVDGPKRPDARAVRFNIEPVRFDSTGQVLNRLVGWGWSPARSAWAIEAQAAVGETTAAILRGRGSGAAGAGTFVMDADLAPGRSLHLEGRRAASRTWNWHFSGKDDGALVSSIIPFSLPGEVRPPRGEIDFVFQSEGGSDLEGEARVQALAFDVGEGGPWTLDGLVCVAKGTVGLQDFAIARGRSRLQASIEIPVALHAPAGRCAVAGDWDGYRILLDGVVERHGESWTLRSPFVQRGEDRTGPVEIVWESAPNGTGSGRRSGRFRGSVCLGSGSVAFEEDRGPQPGRLLLKAVAVPLPSLAPWLPFRLPGEWSGWLDGGASLDRASGRWRAQGTAVIRNGRLSRLPILEAIGGTGEAGSARNVIRIDRGSTEWVYASGRLLVDRLQIESPSMVLQGTVVYAPPDSLLALLRVSPAGDRALGSVLRLLGGSEGSLDLGIAGRGSQPEIIPLDRSSYGRWQDRIAAARRALGESR